MFRSFVRSGILASCIIVLFLSSTPARALPLAGETAGFSWSLSELWERLVEPIVAIWSSGGGSTNGGNGSTSSVRPCDGAGICDPNG